MYKSLAITRETCAKYPETSDIRFNNTYWQVLSTSQGIFYFSASFYDDRVQDKPVIRVIGMSELAIPTVKTHCQLWTHGQPKPVITKVHEYKLLYGYENQTSYIIHTLHTKVKVKLLPYMLVCDAPNIPDSVSVVQEPCDQATVNLPVIRNQEKPRRDFAVCASTCVPCFDTDLSIRIVEWLELLYILGADKVYVYDKGLHPNVTAVFEYYQSLGKLELTKQTLAGEPKSLAETNRIARNHGTKGFYQTWMYQSLTHNHCFYKNIHRYRYTIHLDIDEVIVPTEDEKWNSLISKLEEKCETCSSYAGRMTFFFDDKISNLPHIPSYMHMLQHKERSPFTPVHFVPKSFFGTAKVTVANNHYAVACLGNCQPHRIDPTEAQMNHYRATCSWGLEHGDEKWKKCTENYRDKTVPDVTLEKYEKRLITKVNTVLKKLGLIH